MVSHRRVRPRPILWDYDQLRAYGRLDTRWAETLGYVYKPTSWAASGAWLALFVATQSLGGSRSIVRLTPDRLSDRGEDCPLGRCRNGASLLQYTQKC
jgi:hypothetical protein